MAVNALQSNKARQKFQRVTRLLIAGATTIGREPFDAIHPPATLATVLADPAHQDSIKGAGTTRPQWTQIYPSPGIYGKSEDWDLSLLHKMLRNICGLTQPTTGWDNLPPDTVISKEADLVRLKYYRNSVYAHVDERMQIKDEEFQKLWKNISESIILLAGHLSSAEKKEWEDAIEDFLTAPLTSDDLRNMEELKTWYRQDVELSEQFTELRGDFRKLIGQISPTKQRSLDPNIDTCTEPHNEDQLVEWFCEVCRECACRTCVTLHHTTHPCFNMNDPAYIQTVTQQLLETSEKVRCEIGKHKILIREIQENSSLRNNKLNKLKHEIKATVNNWIEELREQEEKLITNIETTEKVYQENDDSQLRDIAEHVQKMETWMRYTEKLANEGSAVNKMIQKEQTFRCKDELIAMDLKIEPKTITGCLFTRNVNLFRQIKDIGTVSLWDCVAEGEGLKKAFVGVRSTFTIKTTAVCCTMRNKFKAFFHGLENEKVYDPTAVLNETLRSPQDNILPAIQDNKDGTCSASFIPTHPGNHENENNLTIKLNVEIQSPQGTVIPTIQDNKDGTYLVSFVPVRQGDHQISITLQNKLSEKEQKEQENLNDQEILGSPFTVAVKPIMCRPVLTFGKRGTEKGEFDTPFQVAINNKDEIMVIDYNNKRVQVFSSEGEHLRTIDKKGTGAGEFHRPYSIVSDEDNNIIVVDNRNCCVHVYTETGEFIRSFGSKGIGQLKDPTGLSLDTDGNVIVTDWGDGRVKVFSKNGKWLKSFDFGDKPWHCVAHRDRCYVSSRSDHCIKVFDKSGTFLCKYGERGSSLGAFDFPSGLTVDKAGHLIVCDTRNDRVQIIEPDSTFVESFGVLGEGLGQFRRPHSVAVTRDGSIVVCDTRNHRIQIWQ